MSKEKNIKISMPPSNNETNQSNNSKARSAVNEQRTKDRISLVVSLLFVIGLALLGYRYFNTANVNPFDFLSRDNDTTQGDIISSNTERDNETATTETPDETVTQTEEPTTPQAFIWVANSYNQGEIQAGNYTVKSGDTLWELAEGVYGNGADWVKILDANSNSVDFLEGGQQALIFPGQVLVIPGA
jgi:nucleoid-associated protein YgaU